ncbi:hypothetical protein MSG28_010029 [Choristoneura fumiferana]|uniref:Uncharacterized protein n=1 Tax=Choristoneura fumiferana TaxID=7141 RepID=A0ACC0KIY5_CHOFU|nr:hypothetical protein MSG28_010029 [Choristoneura fumiferana]
MFYNGLLNVNLTGSCAANPMLLLELSPHTSHSTNVQIVHTRHPPLRTFTLPTREVPCSKDQNSSKDEPAVCSSCNAVINGRIVTALNKKWHPEHFQCHTCRKPIDGAKFHQHDGAVHCVPCFTEHHSPRFHVYGNMSLLLTEDDI